LLRGGSERRVPHVGAPVAREACPECVWPRTRKSRPLCASPAIHSHEARGGCVVPDRRAGRVASRDSGAARPGVWRCPPIPTSGKRTTPCASPATHSSRSPAVLSQAGELGAQRRSVQVPLSRGGGGVPQFPTTGERTPPCARPTTDR